MTNKNLKLAAMSVALTACVAAQPLVAHAVDAPAEPEGKDPDPKALWKKVPTRRTRRARTLPRRPLKIRWRPL